MTIMLSELISQLEAFRAQHGDAPVNTEYWCEDCQDFHKGESMKVEINSDGEVDIRPRELWDEPSGDEITLLGNE